MAPFDRDPTPSSHSTATLEDPWALPLAQRRRMRDGASVAQARWLPILAALVEPPTPSHDFPAFLLATAPFASLRERLGAARARADLDFATLDELQHFVDRYRDYLRVDGDAMPSWRRDARI